MAGLPGPVRGLAPAACCIDRSACAGRKRGRVAGDRNTPERPFAPKEHQAASDRRVCFTMAAKGSRSSGLG